MHSYPIWNDVSSCIYSSDKSYGAKDTSTVTVRVGTSKTNSEVLVQHVTTKRTDGEYTVFRFGVDCGDGAGFRVLKTMWMHMKTQKWYREDPCSNDTDIDSDRDHEPAHMIGCVCADCSGSELTADND